MTLPWMDRSAKRLRIYLGESDQWRGQPLYAVLLEKFKQEGLAGATVMRGVAGFGAHSRIHTAAILRLSQDLPLVVEVVDRAEKIEQAMQIVTEMVREGLATVEDVDVLLYTQRNFHPLPVDQPVATIMTHDPVRVRADEVALEAWKRMLTASIKALPVVDADGHVVGILSEDDLVERAGLTGRLAIAKQLSIVDLSAEFEILRKGRQTVSAVMSQPVITIQPQEGIGAAAERLSQHEITRLPVVDMDGRILGIVSRLDILRTVLNLPETQAGFVEPTSPGPNELPAVQEVAAVMERALVKRSILVKDDSDLPALLWAFVSTREHRLIVVDRQGNPLGIVTDSDVIRRIQPQHRKGVIAALRGQDRAPEIHVTARELMSPGVETVLPEVPVVEAVRRMMVAQRKWLVVVDDQGKAIGLIDRAIALAALI